MKSINNYDLRRPYQKRKIYKYLLMIKYNNDLHHIFIANETERQLLTRINKILIHKQKDKINFVCVYEIYPNDYLQFYGEYNEKRQ